MQTSALPDLAHTDTTPMHWLATAAAMAAVVAAAGLLQPDASASASTPHRTVAQHGASPALAPDPAHADFPLECGGAGHTVAKQAPGDLDGDGRPETVAVVHCAAGSGTPPSGVYVLTQGNGAAPRIVATLVDPVQKMSVGDFAVRDGVVSATLLGYSSPSVPSCCPDEQEQVTWQWRNGAFVRSSRPQDPAGAGV
ncbi:hypothetical protein P8A21_07425 [Streptomyces poriferorum]|uniref:Secreted protein n=1 Tax=Streptomyces poriferorum TaxID=2798799 RepID=A0ABY9IWY6_9ACTN|nr:MULTISPECIES: hypothetical protein [unclassified Streptomyces]MDP5310893.1 hypothetical protein [Streptomyces sp. Alt4]WLQ47340.1 hypothetical protein P8A21_07425 [Streptomyces sp. Alt1]WLQ59973.1 hypothetical protein P8A19_33140 [Streptomyces sp. Alt2]WSI62155.1 hypothetical protein OG471_08755 [Streptomyces sp. NBC_01336]